jgi:hypothetical protein
MSARVAEHRVVHRLAASSAAGKTLTELPDLADDTDMSMRGRRLELRRNWADQKIVPLRIVLKPRFA